MAEHSILGAAAPPWGEPSAETDGSPSIVTGVAFYSTATDWFVVGGRLRIPPGSGLSGSVTLGLRVYAYEATPDFSTATLRSAVATIADGWIEARWAIPYALAATDVAWITVEDFGTNYMFDTLAFVTPFQALDGSDLYMAEAGTQWRSAFRLGAGATTASTAYYGLDILVDDGNLTGDVTIAGVGTVLAEGDVVIGSDASLSALAALTATGEVVLGSSATLTGTGSVIASGSVDAQVGSAVTIAGVGTITATGSVTGDFADWCEPLTVEMVVPNYTVDLIVPNYTVEVRKC